MNNLEKILNLLRMDIFCDVKQSYYALSLPLRAEVNNFLLKYLSGANISYDKFLAAHPFFEECIQICDLSPYGVAPYSEYASRDVFMINQIAMPSIILEDRDEVKILLAEPFSLFCKNSVIQILKQRYSHLNFSFFASTKSFLNDIYLALRFKSLLVSSDLSSDFIPSLISFSMLQGASDIHLLEEEVCKIKLRIDGVLIDFFNISNDLFFKLSKKLKLLCKIDINESRYPIDGHFGITLNKDIDLRLSFLPMLDAECVVIRVPSIKTKLYKLDDLGLKKSQVDILKRNLKGKSGLILVSGPTGSGKSTLLYSCLNYINDGSLKIITIEDPIEQVISQICQTQVNYDIDLDFTKILKHSLRQDPDVIMIGEIRDYDTLDIALKASLSGHLVLASIHANSCINTIYRLLDLGAKPFLISSCTRFIISQRLVKKSCPYCKKSLKEASLEKKSLDNNKKDSKEVQNKSSTGCSWCYFTGYLGRALVAEMLELNPLIQEKIYKQEDLSSFMSEENLSLSLLDLYKQDIIDYDETFI